VSIQNRLDQTLLQRSLGPSFGKGLRYFRDGRVELLRHDDQHAEGRVRGSMPAPYETDVHLSTRGPSPVVYGQCSCPIGVDCKHVAALALAWLDAQHSGATGAPQAPQRSASRHATQALPQAPSPWKQWLAEHRDDQPASVESPDEESILYLVEVKDGDVLVQPARCRLLKSGHPGAARPVRLDSDKALEQIRRLPTADRTLLLSIDPAQRQYRNNDPWFVLADGDEALLEPMVATGRAHFGAPAGPVLRPGPARKLAFEWQLDEHGTQRLTARLSSGKGMVCGDAWGWYVDPDRAEVGRTEAGELTPQLPALRELPPLHPEHYAEARAALAKRRISARLPAPRALRIQTRRVATPRAELMLGRQPYDHEADRLRYGVLAELAFRYDTQRVAASDRREALRQRDGDAIDVVLREPEYERRVAQFLSREGFRPEFQQAPGDPRIGQAARWERPHPLQGLAIEEWVRGFVERAKPFALDIETDDRFPAFVGTELEAPELELLDSGNDWFEARLGIVIDGQRIDLMPILLKALADPAAISARGLRVMLPGDRPALVPRARLDAILGLIDDFQTREGKPGVTRALLPAVVPPSDWRFVASPRARAFLDELAAFEGVGAIEPTAGFKAELRPYQKVGLAWMDFLRRYGFGGVLADDMGLGKTVQVLAYLAREQAEKRLAQPALVVCPTSVAPNWLSEAHRFTPDLKVELLGRGDRSDALAALPSQDLVITSYALLLRDIEVLAAQSWSMVVFDEAQWLKNRTSQSYRSALRIKAGLRLCLTGTPVENHLGELKAQFDLAFPGLLGDDRHFLQRFRQPIEKSHDPQVARRLRQRLRPFLLRRTKQEVATELPPRTHIAVGIELGEAQRDLYEGIRIQMEKRVRDVLVQRGLARSHITVLDALLKLRQVCCDPRLVDLPSARKVKASAKREALMDLLPTLIEDGRSVLLFSQFTTMLDLIEADVTERGLTYARLDGSTRNRRLPVERFQRGEVPLFLVSLKAGGVGLNLTRADTVILYDPWWNPATEAQAIDRAHRIGQDKPVFVYELTCTGTVEEKMASLKARKRAVADAVLAGGESAIETLQADDLLSLFGQD